MSEELRQARLHVENWTRLAANSAAIASVQLGGSEAQRYWLEQSIMQATRLGQAVMRYSATKAKHENASNAGTEDER